VFDAALLAGCVVCDAAAGAVVFDETAVNDAAGVDGLIFFKGVVEYNSVKQSNSESGRINSLR
jgi:hypothetical protein